MQNTLFLLTVVLVLRAQIGSAQEIGSTFRAEVSTLSVHFDKGLLSVEVEHIAWPKLLQEVSRRTGTTLRVHIPLEGTVTLSFIALPLEQALERLFGPTANFMFVYRERPTTKLPSKVPSEVWVLGREQRGVTTAAFPLSAPKEPVIPETQSADDEAEFESDPQAVHNAALGSFDTAVRFKAIALLGQKRDQQAVNSLLELFHDPDPGIQRSALDALGPLAGPDQRVRKAFTEVMNKTKDSDTRELAADYLGIPVKDDN